MLQRSTTWSQKLADHEANNWRPGLRRRQRRRQLEPRQDAAFEPGHRAAAIAGEGQDDEADADALTMRHAQIHAEGWLAVGSGGQEVEAAAGAEDGGAEAGRGI